MMADVAQALREEILSDHVLMVAAGLGFYAVLGLLPALAGAAAIWGQFADFASLKHSVASGRSVLPHGLVPLLQQFVTNVPEGFGSGIGLAMNLGLIVLTSYRAADGLLTALNIVYDVTEKRGRLGRAAVALAVGTCGIVLLFTALALMTLPPLLAPDLGTTAAVALLWLRWPVLALVFAVGLSLLFRYAPCRDDVCWRWVLSAATTATVLWTAASAGVSFYAAHIASFGRFYGSLGSVAVVLVWFYASALAVLAGAEIDGVLTARSQGRPRGRFRAELRRFERRTTQPQAGHGEGR